MRARSSPADTKPQTTPQCCLTLFDRHAGDPQWVALGFGAGSTHEGNNEMYSLDGRLSNLRP